MEKPLDTFSAQEKGVVKRISAEGKLKRRLFDMGITRGAQIIMQKAAPLGDPLEINIRGYELTLRKAEAQAVIMEVTD
ncbi:MAG: ferrous iron transport protein A [Christensenellaceae bacterium]|jgi:Fe2+ transport system protein FeoA|nr:ferrous iron transport protein A [Christensenellaceae bacterium]